MNEALALAAIGLFSGMLLGFATRFGRFCSLGAIEDIVYGGRYYRSLMWVSTIGYSLLAMGFLVQMGWFDLSQALYLRFTPNYAAHIFGGLIFGYGMAMAGMCGLTALARLGTGDLRALFVVLFIGVSSYVASSGLLSPLREWVFSYKALPVGGPLPSFASLSPRPEFVFYALGLALAIAPLFRLNYRRSAYPLWSMLMSAGIIGGWAGTMWVKTQSFAPVMVESHTFSLPVGESVLYLMLSSGLALTFGIGSVSGVILGSIIASIIKREIHWEACDDARELRRQLGGAVLMGFGAVIAFGCSIGQGLSAMAVLSFGAPLTLASIALGAYLGLKYLIEG